MTELACCKNLLSAKHEIFSSPDIPLPRNIFNLDFLRKASGELVRKLSTKRDDVILLDPRIVELSVVHCPVTGLGRPSSDLVNNTIIVTGGAVGRTPRLLYSLLSCLLVT